MAYNASNEKQVDFGSAAKNQRGDVIKVQRIVPNDKNKMASIDVRNMYTADDGKVYPAKQGGLRMNSELVVEVMLLMYKAMSADERLDFQDGIDSMDVDDGKDDTEDEMTTQDDD